MTYHEDSLQNFCGDWWINTTVPHITRGSLIKAFAHHTDQHPMILTLTGRSSPTDHNNISYQIEPLQYSKPYEYPKLPVAAVPARRGERQLVLRAKIRSLIVINTPIINGPTYKDFKGGAPWQYKRAFIGVPGYGVDLSNTRTGWNQEFSTRIRHCEYPEYLWCMTPSERDTSETLIYRFDQMQPIGFDQKAYKILPYQLSKEALQIFDEQLEWFLWGQLDPNGILYEFRRDIKNI